MRSRWSPWLPLLLALVVLVGAGSVGPPGAGTAAARDPLPPAATPSSVGGSPAPTPVPTGPVEVAPGYRASGGVAVLGALPATASLSVAVGLPSRDPAGLSAFVDAASVPGTPEYHQFLSAPAAASEFGASSALVAAARGYFAGFGLSTEANPDGLLLSVSGTAPELGAAFDTTFDAYLTPSGRTFVSHPTPAMLPGSLETDGVFGLGNVTPLAPGASVVPLAGELPAASCAGPAGGLAPCAIQTAYNESALLTAGTNGTGTTIAVVDAYASAENQTQLTSDLSSFAAASSLPVGTVNYDYPVATSVDLNGSGIDSGWGVEDALDLEWARAAAPGATIDMTFSPNPDAGLYEAIDWLVAGDAANVISMSWGEPDVGVYNAFSTPCNVACNASTDGSYEILGPVLALGAAEGITFVAASGDCGAADGTSGLSTNFPASDPYVTGVGGTDLTLGAADSYGSETAWSGNQSGATTPGCENQGGSGGGFAPFSQPWWQSGISDPTGHRGVPDVSMDADNPVAIVLDGTGTGVIGTSVGTPIWAGIAAVADQYAHGDLGLLDPSLYAVLRGPSYSSDFHDVTEGSNGYAAGTGWDPVTGIGTPIVSALVPALARGGGLAGNGLSASVFASPRSGDAPLTASIAMDAAGGDGSYPLEGISFGDGSAALYSGSALSHTYSIAGGYLVQAFVADGSGNTSVSLPVLVTVGTAPLVVSLSVSSNATGVGEAVTLSASASGGTAPYEFAFYLGDGSYTAPGAASIAHAYEAAGAFCAEAFAFDSADPADVGASARVAIGVGGVPAGSCTSGTPLTVSPNGTPPILDAPADYEGSLFTVSGGATGPGGLTPTTSVVSNDSYIAACGCEIFRHPGNYSVTEWANDSVDGSAEASVNVTVAPALDATFAASTLVGPAPLKVYYFSSVKGGYGANSNLTNWTFGNGESATGHSVSTTYETAGEYFAVGRLSDLGRGNASEAFLIDVEPAVASPAVGVGATISPATDVVSGGSVRFTATAEGPPDQTANTQILWNLGAGRSAFGSAVVETYTSARANLTNNTLIGGITIETSYLDTIFTVGFDLAPFFAIGADGEVPQANTLVGGASVTPEVSLVPFTLYGVATASGPHSLYISWAFGDGSSGSGASVSHTLYAAQGYTVVTTVSDSWGDSATLLSGITANGPLGVAGGPSPAEGPKPLTVTIATTAYGGKGPPYHYDWSFPNGTGSTNPTVVLFFPQIGTYVVHLNVTDRSGAHDERNFTIVVDYPFPLAGLEIVLGGTGIGALIALAVWTRGAPRQPKSDGDPWFDRPPPVSDRPPVW